MITDRELQIASTKIGPGHSTYFIADITANHDGDLSKAKDLIYLAAEAEFLDAENSTFSSGNH